MRRALVLLPLLAVGARAQEFRWGFQAGATFPQGDMAKALDDATGFGGGLHLLADFSGPHALRGRFEAVTFKQGQDALGADARLTGVRLGADYLWFMEGSAGGGPYLAAGLDHTWWRYEVTAPGLDHTDTKGALGGSLALGYQFTRMFGLELEGFTSRFRSDAGAARGLTLVVTFRY